MRSCSLLIVLWVITWSAKSQSLYPGGVKGAIHWYSTDTSSTSPGLRSRLADGRLLTVILKVPV